MSSLFQSITLVVLRLKLSSLLQSILLVILGLKLSSLYVNYMQCPSIDFDVICAEIV